MVNIAIDENIHTDLKLISVKKRVNLRDLTNKILAEYVENDKTFEEKKIENPEKISGLVDEL